LSFNHTLAITANYQVFTMKTFSLPRCVISTLVRILLAGIIAWGGSAYAQVTIFSFNKTAGGTYAWDNAAQWYQTPNTGFPNGIDAIAALTSDISGTATIQLNQLITLGALTIGDQNGSNAFVLDVGAAGSFLFQTTTGTNATLNKVVSGQTEQINVPVTLNSSLDANVTTGTILMTGVVNGGGSFVKWGGGAVEFRGINTYTGLTAINNGGNATSTLRLNTTSGNAIAGDIRLGNATTDGRSAALLVLSRSDQIADTATITFQSAGSHNSFFRLGSAAGTFNETIAGVIDTTGQGVIEGRGGENLATNAVLTINNTDNSIFNGIMRDKSAIETAGTGTLVLVKDGAGVLTLAGGNIRHTGGTTINAGTLVLNNTTFMTGQITNNNATLVFDNSGDQRFITPYTDTSAVLTEKRGGGNLILGEGSIVARTTNTSKTVTVYSGGLLVGMPITGANIPGGTTIESIVDSNTITISNPATGTATSGLTVTGGGTRTFASPFLASDGTVIFRANTVFNAGLTTDGANLTIDAGKTVTVNGALNFMEGEIFAQNGTLQVNGNMLFSGAGALGSPPNAQYQGTGTTVITGTLTLDNPNATFAVPISVGGAITLDRGTTTLNGTGAFTGAHTSITQAGNGILTLSSTGATDRIGNAVSFIGKGGTLTYSHGTGSTETIGTLNLQAGRTLINLVSVGASSTGTLTFASLARSAGSSLSFTATDAVTPTPSLVLGGANKVIFTSGVSGNLDDGIIGGWARMGNEWATYTANGVEPLATYTLNTAETSWAATQNIKENSANRALSASRTINSLNIQGGTARTVSMSNNAFVLTVASGGILSSGAQHIIGSAANNGILTAGPSAGVSSGLYELNVNVGDSATRQLLINSVIANNGNPVSLVKAGPGILNLGGANTYTGKTYVNEGILLINSDPRLGAVPVSFVADQLTLNGGTLRAQATFSLAANRGLTIGPGGGTIDVDSGQSFTLSNVVDGSQGMLFKTGLGNVTFSGANSNLMGGVTNNGASATGANLSITGNNTQVGFVDHNNGTTNLGSLATTGLTVGNIRMDGNGIVNINGGVIVQGEIRLNGVDEFNITGNNTINNTITFSAGVATISGNNTYLGSTIQVSGAAVTVTSATALNSPSLIPLIVSTGSFTLDSTDFTVGDLQGAGEVRAAGVTPSNLIVDTIFNSTFSGKLTDDLGTLGIIKRGSGVLALSSVISNYSGPTRIEAGVLDVTLLDFSFGPSSIGASSSDAANLFIADGAGLRYSGSFSQVTDRSFTIGAGSQGAGIYANGTLRGATIDFGVLGFSPAVAVDGLGGISTLNLGGYGLGSNLFNLELPDTGDGIALKKTGSGTWILTNPSNLYKGETTILEGTLGVSANNALGDTNAGTFVYGGRLDLANVAYTAQEDLYLQGGGLSVTQGNSSWAGTVAANALTTITIVPGASLTLSGTLRGHGGITQAGEGTLTLSGANTHASDTDPAAQSGFFTVSAGKLILEYGSNNNSKLGNNGILTLGGGRLGGELVLSGGSHDEVVRATTLGAGTNAVTRTSGTSRLFMNAITRAGGATVNFSASNIATTDTFNVNGILGGYATIAGTDWAKNGGPTGTGANTLDGQITAFTAYVPDTWAPANNTTVTLSSNSQTGATTNTLRFNENKDINLTLNGTNTITASALLMTPNAGTHTVTIDGSGSLRAGGSAVGLDLTLHQYDLNGLLHISAPIANVQPDVSKTGNTTQNSGVINVGIGNTTGLVNGMTVAGAGIPLGATISSINVGAGTVTISPAANADETGSSLLFAYATGLTKNGPGSVLLTGANTYSGVTALNEGVVIIKSLSNMTVPGALGTGGISVAGGLVFNGGTLEYAGSSTTTNRGFTANYDAIFNISRESGNLKFTGGVAGSDSLTKFGEGTLTLAGSATGLINYTADQGLISVIMNSANNRFASSLATLTVAGGGFEVKSDPTASRSQDMNGGLIIKTGASEVRVSSNGVDGSSNPIVTTLILGDPADTSSPINTTSTRQAGGTVLFVENPTNGGTANIRFPVPGIENGVVIPWAAYWDTSSSQAGINNFALASGPTSEIISADDASVYDIGSFFNNPANWTSADDPSEGPAGSFSGTTGGNISTNTLRYIVKDDSLVTVSGQLTIESGAILVGNLVGTGQKTITGGAITSNYSAANGTKDLILHNYNAHSTFVIGSSLVDPSGSVKMNLVQTGTGTTALTGTNAYTGNTYVHGGVLRLDSLNAVPGGIATSGGLSHIVMEEGIIGLNFNNFTRSVGTAVNQIEFKGSGGFAAYTTDRSVNLGGGSTQLTWGAASFLPDGSTLILSNRDADKTVDFQNPIALGIRDRFVRVQNGSDAEDAILSGALSGVGGIIKTDTGTLRMPTASTHAGGVTLGNGTLIVSNNTAIGTGVMNIGTTEDTQADDALIWRIETPSIANNVIVGTLNTQGITSIDFQTINSALTGSIELGKDVFVSPASAITSTFSGAVTGVGGITVTDGGTLRLEGANSYGVSGGLPGEAIDGATILRAGIVVVGQETSLGVGTVELGDVMTPLTAVDRASNGTSVTLRQGSFDPLSNGFISFGGPGAFLDVSTTFDGVTYGAGAVNTRILIKDEDLNPERNGIYEIVSVDTVAGTMDIKRVADLDVGTDMTYGRTVSVTAGSSAAKTFFLASGAATANTSPILWKQDVSDPNPNVALMIGTSLASPITNPIDVNATNGTGTTTIELSSAVMHGSATLSGDITLQSQLVTAETKDLFLTSNNCAELILSGAVTDPDALDKLNLIKTGTGTVTLSGANNYAGFTEVRAGVLKLNNAAALGGGNLNINGGVVGLTTASGNFSRTLGTGASQVQWAAGTSGGFAAYGTNQSATVNSGAALTWGTTPQFLTTGSLVLGSTNATAKVTFTNPIAFGTVARTVNVPNGPTAIEGELSGVLSGGAGGTLNKTGQGTLLLSGINTHTAGTNLVQGTLQGKRTTSGSVFGSGASALINVGTTIDTQTGDALKLEFIGDTEASPVTYSVPAVNGITIGTFNSAGTTSIEATNGNAAATVVDVDVLGAVSLGRRTFVGPDTDAILQFSAAVSGANGSITVVDGGTVRLNAANSYGSGLIAPSGAAIDGATIIRDGTIELSSATATLGTGTVELGDTRTNLAVVVDRASGGMALSDCGAVFSLGTYSGVPTDFGGGSYTVADVGKNLLVKDETGNPARNGIYQISAVSGGDMTLVRVAQFDATSEMVYGTTVQVANGPVPNQNYFMSAPTVATVNTSPVLWREANANPNVALLARVTGTTVTNNIDLNATGSSGTTTLGAVSTLTDLSVSPVVFSGTITMQSQSSGAESLTLDISSAAITNTATGVTFSGLISVNSVGADTLNVRKAGAGVATLSNTTGNTYNGTTAVNAGILLVNNTTGSGTGSGTVTVNGVGTVLGGTGSIAGLTTINSGAILQPGTGVSDANASFDSATESLAFTGGLTLGAGSTALFQLNGALQGSGATGYDFVSVLGAGTTLTVDVLAAIKISLGYSPAANQVFNVLDWTNLTYSGGDLADQLNFVNSNPLDWDTSQFATFGQLTYLAPEPSRMVLLLLGALAGLFHRRRPFSYGCSRR